MKNIVAVFDGYRYSAATIGYAADLAKKTHSQITGVFITDLPDASLGYPLEKMRSPLVAAAEGLPAQGEKMRDVIRLFENICQDKKISYRIHRHQGVAMNELLEESVFADLILIDTKTSFHPIGNEVQGPFLKDLLAECNCPLLIIPDEPVEINKAIVTYDGSKSSVYAMKMFSYVFPEWTDLKVILVTVKQTSSNHFPHDRNIKDLARSHFKNVSFTLITGHAWEELEKYLRKNGNDAVVVMGAYGRNDVSRMFHESMADRILKKVKVPLFISHQ